MFRCLLSLSLVLILLASTEDVRAAGNTEFFERKIRPVLAKHCYRCHSADAKTLRGKLRLDSSVAILKGGQSGAVLDSKNGESSNQDNSNQVQLREKN